MTKSQATIRFIGSLIWLAGILYLFNLMSVVPHGGWHDNSEVLEFGDKFQFFMSIGLAGLFQSAAFVKVFFGMLDHGLNTHYEDVYKDSSGREVKREYNTEATASGCLMSFIVGLLLMFVCSAIASPFVFCYNLCHFIDAWTRDTSAAGFFKLVAVILVIATLAGTYFGGKWLYAQVDEVGKYKDAVREQKERSRYSGCYQERKFNFAIAERTYFMV